MSRIINIHDAKTRLVPLEAKVLQKKLGLLQVRIKVPDDFNAPLPPEMLAGFEGR